MSKILNIAKVEILRNKEENSKSLKLVMAFLVFLILFSIFVRINYSVETHENIYSVDNKVKGLDNFIKKSSYFYLDEKNPDMDLDDERLVLKGSKGEASFYRFAKLLERKNYNLESKNHLLVKLKDLKDYDNSSRTIKKSNVSNLKNYGGNNKEGSPDFSRNTGIAFKDFDVFVQKTIYNKKVEPDNISSSLPKKAIALSVLIISPLIFISSLYSNSFFLEKDDDKASMLIVSPVDTYKIVLGKSMPYYILGGGLSVILILLTGISFNLLIMFNIFSLLLLYFSVHFGLAVTADDSKDLSFLKTFTGSTLIGFLIVPTFFVEVTNWSYISPLSPLVASVVSGQTKLFFYLTSSVPTLLTGILVYYVFLPGFRGEFILKTSLKQKVFKNIKELFKSPRMLIFSGLLTVPVALLFELGLVGIGILLGGPGILLTLLGGIFVEESLKGYIATLYDENYLIRGILTGISFGLIERLFLLIKLDYTSLIFSNSSLFFVPIIFHGFLTALFVLAVRNLETQREKLIKGLVLTVPIHFLYNVLVLVMLNG